MITSRGSRIMWRPRNGTANAARSNLLWSSNITAQAAGASRCRPLKNKVPRCSQICRKTSLIHTVPVLWCVAITTLFFILPQPVVRLPTALHPHAWAGKMVETATPLAVSTFCKIAATRSGNPARRCLDKGKAAKRMPQGSSAQEVSVEIGAKRSPPPHDPEIVRRRAPGRPLEFLGENYFRLSAMPLKPAWVLPAMSWIWPPVPANLLAASGSW